MKKTLAVLLACLLALAAMGASAQSQSDAFAGQWTLVSAYDAQQGGWIDLAAGDVSMSFAFEEGGGASVSSGDVEAGGLTWIASDAGVAVEGNGASYALKTQSDGTLALEQGDITLFFRRAGEETADVLGSWTLDSVGVQGETMDPAALGLEMVVAFSADGACQVSAYGMTQNASWTPQEGGALVDEGEGVQTSYLLQADGTLLCEQSGVSLIFVRSGDAQVQADAPTEADAAQAPEGARTDAALADFNGAWNVVYVLSMGMQMEPETVGLDMALTIADGSLTIASNGQASTYAVALENGALVYNTSSMDIPIYLREDGTLSMAMELGGLSMEIIFERA